MEMSYMKRLHKWLRAEYLELLNLDFYNKKAHPDDKSASDRLFELKKVARKSGLDFDKEFAQMTGKL